MTRADLPNTSHLWYQLCTPNRRLFGPYATFWPAFSCPTFPCLPGQAVKDWALKALSARTAIGIKQVRSELSLPYISDFVDVFCARLFRRFLFPFIIWALQTLELCFHYIVLCSKQYTAITQHLQLHISWPPHSMCIFGAVWDTNAITPLPARYFRLVLCLGRCTLGRNEFSILCFTYQHKTTYYEFFFSIKRYAGYLSV